MISVKVYHDKQEIARIRFKKVRINSDREADYLAEVAVEKLGRQKSIGMYRVVVEYYDRIEWSALELVRLALDQMRPEDLKLDEGTSASDMAWGFNRALQAVQAWSGRLRNH